MSRFGAKSSNGEFCLLQVASEETAPNSPETFLQSDADALDTSDACISTCGHDNAMKQWVAFNANVAKVTSETLDKGAVRSLLLIGGLGSGKSSMLLYLHTWASRSDKMLLSFAINSSSALQSKSYTADKLNLLVHSLKQAVALGEAASLGGLVVCVDDIHCATATEVELLSDLLLCAQQLPLGKVVIVVTGDFRMMPTRFPRYSLVTVSLIG